MHTHTHSPLERVPAPAGSRNAAEEEEYQTTGSFVWCGLLKHGHHSTAAALLKRTRDQPPFKFHSNVRESMFVTITVLRGGEGVTFKIIWVCLPVRKGPKILSHASSTMHDYMFKYLTTLIK